MIWTLASAITGKLKTPIYEALVGLVTGLVFLSQWNKLIEGSTPLMY